MKNKFSKIILPILIAFFPVSSVYGDSIKKPVVIGIIRTIPPYAVAQEEGLKKSLKELGYVEGKDVVYLPTRVVYSRTEDVPKNEKIARELLDKKPDIIATIGTQSSVSVWPVARKTNIPMVFAGVTYPIEEHLIQAFGKPTGENITGLSYGLPTVTRLGLLRRMFPDTEKFNTLAFVYNGNIPQEITYVSNLKSLVYSQRWNLSYIDFFDYKTKEPSYELLINKIKETDPDVIFGWFSLDELSSNLNKFKKLLNQIKKPFVGISSKFIEEGGIGGIITDHYILGKEQAKMIDRIIQGEKAGDIPPMEPTKYLMELNLKKANELGIEFDLDIIAAADKILK